MHPGQLHMSLLRGQKQQVVVHINGGCDIFSSTAKHQVAVTTPSPSKPTLSQRALQL